MLIALYILAALVIAYAIDRLRPSTWDLDIVGYAAAVLALTVAAGVLGPTLDSNTVAKDGGTTAYAARQP